LEGEVVGGIGIGRLDRGARFGAAEAEGGFDGVGDAGFGAGADDEAVDDDFDGGGRLGPGFGGFLDFENVSVEADADEALALEVALSSKNSRRFNENSLRWWEVCDGVGHAQATMDC
jgi:hypothetical protein